MEHRTVYGPVKKNMERRTRQLQAYGTPQSAGMSLTPGRLRLQDCADIQTGLAFTRRVEGQPNGTHQVLLGKHVEAGPVYHYREEHCLRVVPERPPGPYLAQVDDVVFVARGAQNAAAVLKTLAPVPTMVSSTFFRIRPHPGLLPTYLAWYLHQAPARRFIDSARSGTISPTIQRSRFVELPIPLPPIEVQTLICDQLTAMAEEAELRRLAWERTRELHAAISARLLRQIDDTIGAAHG